MRERSPSYRDPAEMERAIDAYFRDCEGQLLRGEDGEPVLDRGGKPLVVNAHPPTVSGLALALGFPSRKSLLNYQGKPGFAEIVGRAILRVEDYCEGRLYDKDGRQGAEFALRHNFSWLEAGEDGNRGETGVVVLAPEEAADG